jgi:hypothetical protein
MKSFRHLIRVVGGVFVMGAMLSVNTNGALAAEGASVSASTLSETSAPSQTSSPSTKVMSVRLTKGEGIGSKRTYFAEVLNGSGEAIENATLDIGGLGTDPDLRLPTTKMVLSPGSRTQYEATLRYPSDGDWVLVVRVHAPSQAVELFTEAITDTGLARESGHGSSTPSQRAILNADPTFFDRYSLTGATSGVASPKEMAHAPEEAGLAEVHETEAFDIQAPIIALLHSIGSLAWIGAVLGLVLANRIGSGAARTEITSFIARHYRTLAGGGLAVVALTGPYMVAKASAGLGNPTELLRSNLGTVYLAVFAFKLVLVAGSLLTTWRIQQALPSAEQFAKHRRLASVGSMANDDMSAYHPTTGRAFQLAEANAQIGAMILGCVVLLGQLHHVLH